MNWRTWPLAVLAAVPGAVPLGAVIAAPPTTTPPTTAGPTSTATTTTTAATTTSASTTTSTTSTTAPSPTSTTAAPTTTAVPVDRLAGVNWLQLTLPSPCSDASVQLIGGATLDGSTRAVLDDVVGLDSTAGLALAFLACRGPGGTTTQRTAVVVEVATNGAVTVIAERELGAGANVVAVDGGTVIVEIPGAPADGACCAEVVTRQTFTASANGITAGAADQVPAFEQTVTPAPVVGADAELIRRSVSPAALCFRWDNTWLTAPAEPAEQDQLVAPSAELETIRLALIHLTGRWIAPTGAMSPEMAEVVAAYQESRGLTVDGAIGRETTGALAVDLGCPETGSFEMVLPRGLGPRNFDSVASLVAAIDRFARTGRTGYESLDQMLTDARWDPGNAMFLGCYRWESPSTGLSCSWSGTTPLQLVGLVRDPATLGVSNFTILYARSAAL